MTNSSAVSQKIDELTKALSKLARLRHEHNNLNEAWEDLTARRASLFVQVEEQRLEVRLCQDALEEILLEDQDV